ncbi:MAG: SUMF1/EgtB/PvdO family nonheme iron enzyme [Chloroflexi bacterium]|nr:SUMF1/EgtB/PvdO family nonheme iron enzyme [Chloroflexota bacterium]
MAQFFVSYSRVDETFTKEFVSLLQNDLAPAPTHYVWYDRYLTGTQVWWQEILRQIAAADVFIYLLSNESVTSPYCQAEFEEARRLQKIVLTVQVRDRTRLSDELADLQYVDMKQGIMHGPSVARLAAAVNLALANAAAHTEPPPPLWDHATPKPDIPDEPPRPTDTQDVETPQLEAKRTGTHAQVAVEPAPPEQARAEPHPVEASRRGGWLMFAFLAVIVLVVAVETVRQNPDLLASLGLAGGEPQPEHPGEFPEMTFAGVARNREWEPIIREIDGVPMALVPVGCFEMGMEGFYEDEVPITPVCFDTPFWIDVTEVTQEQFGAWGGEQEEPPAFGGEIRPVEQISWYEAVEFCEMRDARLPTEAEWEYAARGPESWVFPWGNEFVPELVIFAETSGDRTAPVGTRPEGASWVGALDMAGNVWEWTYTLHWEYPYDRDDGRETDSDDDPHGSRTKRGGSWQDGSPEDLRAAIRYGEDPFSYENTVGFRCVRDF